MTAEKPLTTIWFKTIKGGKVRAYYWSGLQFRSFPISNGKLSSVPDGVPGARARGVQAHTTGRLEERPRSVGVIQKDDPRPSGPGVSEGREPSIPGWAGLHVC